MNAPGSLPPITVPRPHVPHGPQGVPADVADADYLRTAGRALAEHYQPFGSNLRATVVQLILDAADAIESGRVIEYGVEGRDGTVLPCRDRANAEDLLLDCAPGAVQLRAREVTRDHQGPWGPVAGADDAARS